MTTGPQEYETDIVASYILIDWVWALLEQNAGMQKINGIIPITNVSDNKVLAESGKPYLVYGFSEARLRKQRYYIVTGTIVFRINAPTFATLNRISNTIRRGSETLSTVDAVNNFKSSLLYDASNIKFTDVALGFLEGGEPVDEEGGYQWGNISITYDYMDSGDIIIPGEVGLWNGIR